MSNRIVYDLEREKPCVQLVGEFSAAQLNEIAEKLEELIARGSPMHMEIIEGVRLPGNFLDEFKRTHHERSAFPALSAEETERFWEDPCFAVKPVSDPMFSVGEKAGWPGVDVSLPCMKSDDCRLLKDHFGDCRGRCPENNLCSLPAAHEGGCRSFRGTGLLRSAKPRNVSDPKEPPTA
jgi:hypothetical protein